MAAQECKQKCVRGLYYNKKIASSQKTTTFEPQLGVVVFL
jgi:hypothetical protein